MNSNNPLEILLKRGAITPQTLDVRGENPIQAAMQPQQQQQPQNPIMAAMQPQPQQKQGIMNSPHFADALIRGGAAMMGSPSMLQGMSQGATAFMDTMDAKTKAGKEEKIRNQPKVIPVANGAYSLVVHPDGRVEQKRNTGVAEYNESMAVAKDQRDIDKIHLKARIAEASKNDAALAKNYDDFTQSTQQSISRARELDSLASLLDGTDKATGPIIGLLPKFARDIMTPMGADIQDRAEQIIQANLRETLGAQFTEKEGARFLERAYNPRHDEATNAARLRAIASEMKTISQNKAAALEYFRRNGTLEGFASGGQQQPTPQPQTQQPQGGYVPVIDKSAQYLKLK